MFKSGTVFVVETAAKAGLAYYFFSNMYGFVAGQTNILTAVLTAIGG